MSTAGKQFEADADPERSSDLRTPVEVLALTTLGIIELLRRQEVCFYPGPHVPVRPNDIMSFLESLPYLGKATALIFCAPHLRKADVREQIQNAALRDQAIELDWNECVGIEDDLIWRDDLLFLPPRPADAGDGPRDQFWADFCILKFSGKGMKLLLLHLGMTSEQAQECFLEPHGIRASVTIFNPGQQ